MRLVKTATLAGAAVLAVAAFLLAGSHWAVERNGDRGSGSLTAAPAPALVNQDAATRGFLYGRVHTSDGPPYEGRLRFGGDQEAFWGDYFNGSKKENAWESSVDPERLLRKREPLQIAGLAIPLGSRRLDLRRPFMARFGDIARIEAGGRDLNVTLKSGTTVHLDRFGADDLADGLRVWDASRGVVDLEEWQVRAVELLPTARVAVPPSRLHATVRTAQGTFTGFIQWNREKGVGEDELAGRAEEGERRVRFDTVRSIARVSRDRAAVTLLDGRSFELAALRPEGLGDRGVYVDDRRYGRVLVPWDLFDRADFATGGSGPAYTDFPTGSPLLGTVTLRDGRRLTGRLVYDLDESETTETLDAPAGGVNYTIPFGLIASLALGGGEERRLDGARITLHGGEELRLDRTGDLSEENAGMLIFVNGSARPEFVPWPDVQQIDFERPAAMYPAVPSDRPGRGQP